MRARNWLDDDILYGLIMLLCGMLIGWGAYGVYDGVTGDTGCVIIERDRE